MHKAAEVSMFRLIRRYLLQPFIDSFNEGLDIFRGDPETRDMFRISRSTIGPWCAAILFLSLPFLSAPWALGAIALLVLYVAWKLGSDRRESRANVVLAVIYLVGFWISFGLIGTESWWRAIIAAAWLTFPIWVLMSREERCSRSRWEQHLREKSSTEKVEQ
jgi:hypothetical protein